MAALRDWTGQHLPAILITADRSDALRRMAARDDISVISKPVKLSRLRPLVDWAIQPHGRRAVGLSPYHGYRQKSGMTGRADRIGCAAWEEATMMKRAALACALALMIAAGPGLAASTDGEATYDLLFRDGTLDRVDRDRVLVYDRDVTNTLKPDAAARDSGEIALRIEQEGHGDGRARISPGRQVSRHGVFPASVGNPMIMVFYESVVRDMAESAGGSAFYIRNRVKEALIEPAEVEAGTARVGGKEVATRTIRLHPFEGDPNADRMMGFGDLELSVTMSDAVPGWYVSLVAEAPAPDGSGPIYRSSMTYRGTEPVQ